MVVSAFLAAFGCSTSGSPPPLGGDTCPLSQSHYYQTAGCGTTAPAPVCEVDDVWDAQCPGVKQVCTCAGFTEPTSCAGHAKSPFATEGACPPDAGADGATDAGSDAASSG